MPSVNPLVLDTASPPIPEAWEWARRYGGHLGKLLDLCQAVPGYPPHPEMLAKLGRAAADPEAARYGALTGDEKLREAFAASVSDFYGGSVGADHVAITSGCNQAFVITLMALARQGDAVLMPTPWYFNYQMIAEMLGISLRLLPSHATDGFVPDPERAVALLDDRVCAIVLVTPNNPTGAVYPPDIIARFYRLCRERNIWLVLDETYRDFLPPGVDRPHELLSGNTWPEGLVQLYSFSKSFCIPGHRLGAFSADPAFITQVSKIIDCVQICPQRAGQMALLWAIDALTDWRRGNREEINRRADALRAVFANIPQWRVESLGAYFAYVRHPFPGVPASRVAERMAAERGALCLPGTCFGPGQEDHLRVAFANATAPELAELVGRLQGWSWG
jgi:aspartate/methionine/tyrosine aminotransferase